MPSERDERYVGLIMRALSVCARYKPMFGKGRKGGMTLRQFQQLYRSDPFYKWMGLDSPLMYAAHKAAGGMTSVYRQLGIGCQWVFQNILKDSLGLSDAQATWIYRVPTTEGKSRSLSLDGRIEFAHIRDTQAKQRVERWASAAADKLLLTQRVRRGLKGVVFEVRQGYKSKDSKRQNADISNASNAYAHLYIPTLLLLSAQIDNDVAARYTQARWLLLTGTTSGGQIESTYTFCRDVLDYDLAGFFRRHSRRIKVELEKVLKTLLRA